MTMKHNRKLSTCVYMSIIAVNDNFFLLLALHAWYKVQIDPWHLTKWLCKIKSHLVHASGTFGAYQIVLMTLDKFIAIKFPHKAKSICTAKRAKILSFCNFVFVIIYYLPNLSFTQIIGNTTQCSRYVTEGWYVTGYLYLSSIINPLVPVISLFAMNIIIIRVVVKRTEIRTTKSKSNSERQITIMLILVSVMFVVLLLPFEIRDNYYLYAGKPTNPKDFATFVFLFLFTFELFNLNYGINFFLYLISGTKFRRDLMSLFCRKGFDRSLSQSESSQSGSISKDGQGSSVVTDESMQESGAETAKYWPLDITRKHFSTFPIQFLNKHPPEMDVNIQWTKAHPFLWRAGPFASLIWLCPFWENLTGHSSSSLPCFQKQYFSLKTFPLSTLGIPWLSLSDCVHVFEEVQTINKYKISLFSAHCYSAFFSQLHRGEVKKKTTLDPGASESKPCLCFFSFGLLFFIVRAEIFLKDFFQLCGVCLLPTSLGGIYTTFCCFYSHKGLRQFLVFRFLSQIERKKTKDIQARCSCWESHCWEFTGLHEMAK